MLALMTQMNHEGETSSTWARLKAKLKILLNAPHVINQALDEGIAVNVANDQRFWQDVTDQAEQIADERRSKQTPAQTQHAT